MPYANELTIKKTSFDSYANQNGPNLRAARAKSLQHFGKDGQAFADATGFVHVAAAASVCLVVKHERTSAYRKIRRRCKLVVRVFTYADDLVQVASFTADSVHRRTERYLDVRKKAAEHVLQLSRDDPAQSVADLRQAALPAQD